MSASNDPATPLPASSISLRSCFDYATTIARFKAELEKRRIALFLQLDQAALAKEVGLVLRPTCFLLFGNPAVGTHVMAFNAHAALDLPLKAVVWEALDGSVFLDFANVQALLAERYAVPESLLAFAAPTAAMMREIAGLDEAAN